jgi:hypothetical protein
MAVEIGELIVRASFGGKGDGERERALAEALARLRHELREEMREMLDEAARRARER